MSDRIAAIGDVHGEADLLGTMLNGLREIERLSGQLFVVYFLGDIVDRGLDSCRALDLVFETIAERPGSRLLLGNHDDWLRRFLVADLTDGERRDWLAQGGAETLRSYGLRGRTGPAEAREAILAAHPRHLQLLNDASILETAGPFAFVHAGVDPTRPLDRQERQDCMWIREPFQRYVGHLEKIVVHGHQPLKGGLPVVTENRISMDTGAVLTGRLSAVLIQPETGSMEFYQARPGGVFLQIVPETLDRGLGTALDRAVAG